MEMMRGTTAVEGMESCFGSSEQDACLLLFEMDWRYPLSTLLNRNVDNTSKCSSHSLVVTASARGQRERRGEQ